MLMLSTQCGAVTACNTEFLKDDVINFSGIVVFCDSSLEAIQ